MPSTALLTPKTVVSRAALIAISLAALLASAYTYVLLALHISSLRYSPGSTLSMVGMNRSQADTFLPAGMEYAFATMTIEVDVVVQGVDHAFLGWQVAAWSSRYGLAIIFLLSLIYLCWRLWRTTDGLGRAMSWWAAGLGALTLTVAVFAPWALIHAQQLVAQVVGVPTSPQGRDPWFIIPGWSAQDADWWLVLVAALLFLLAILLRRAHGTERDARGLI